MRKSGIGIINLISITIFMLAVVSFNAGCQASKAGSLEIRTKIGTSRETALPDSANDKQASEDLEKEKRIKTQKEESTDLQHNPSPSVIPKASAQPEIESKPAAPKSKQDSNNTVLTETMEVPGPPLSGTQGR